MTNTLTLKLKLKEVQKGSRIIGGARDFTYTDGEGLRSSDLAKMGKNDEPFSLQVEMNGLSCIIKKKKD